MRVVIVAAAAIAACGLLASTAVRADPMFEPGGPTKVGGMCKMMTNQAGGPEYGYYAACPDEPMHYAKRTKRMKS